jgi:hypothetical protein
MIASKAHEISPKAPHIIAADAGFGTSHRLAMLGNALVPACARLAFFRLYTGFVILSPEDLRGQKVSYAAMIDRAVFAAWKSGKNKHAQATDDGLSAFSGIVPIRQKLANIVVDPKHYVTSKSYVENAMRPVKSRLITEPVHLRVWPTPRSGSVTHSHNLSERTIRDMMTVAMYASSVGHRKLDRTIDGQRMNPRYVEWLMGYPLDFTRLT